MFKKKSKYLLFDMQRSHRSMQFSKQIEKTFSESYFIELCTGEVI